MAKQEKYDYFKGFSSLTEYIVKSANILKNVMENFDVEKLDENIAKVHHLENEADKITHQTRNSLIKDFLPPIDREDLALISHKLDDIEDGIDEVLINVKIYNINQIKSEVIEQIDILIECCEAVRDTFVDFKNLKNISVMKQKIIKINKLEEDGDRIYEKLMTLLYKNEKDAIELVKWTNIYNCLEATIDSCEKLGDCVEDVIMQNS